jgi:hypothetical protein
MRIRIPNWVTQSRVARFISRKGKVALDWVNVPIGRTRLPFMQDRRSQLVTQTRHWAAAGRRLPLNSDANRPTAWLG